MGDVRKLHARARDEDTRTLTDATVPSAPETVAPSADFQPGVTIGHYLIIAKIGEGGMGIVYKAHDTTLDRTVALKVLSPHLFRSAEFLQRFRIEAQAQARLNGSNIVTLHSLFDTNGSLVLVMEYVEGQTLAQRLQAEGRLSVGSAVWVFEQALIGVERAHRLGIVHRDLKPSNVFITTNREIKLMDFGVAKIMNREDFTQSGSMLGTMIYIAPEQVQGQEADFRSDIYTLGVSLYEAVTGHPPFRKRTDYEYMHAHLHEKPVAPSQHVPDIPKELDDVILKALEKQPETRFQSAQDFRNALLRVGMTHMRAYRRLKRERRERDRGLPPEIRQQPAAKPAVRPAAARPAAPSPAPTPAKKMQPGLRLGGAVALGLALAIVAGIAWEMRSSEPSSEPATSLGAQTSDVVRGTVAETEPAPASAAVPEPTPAPEASTKRADPAPATVTPVAPKVAAVKPLPARAPVPVVKTDRHGQPAPTPPRARKSPAQPAKQADKTYDALRNAWGG
jgi:serine/threonine-protein kinase